MSTSTTTSTEDRALILLGQGIAPTMVASALGVSVSRISQLLSNATFAAAVAELRYESLLKHNHTDSRYDKMEADLQERMENLIPFMMKPFEVLKAIQIINAAKRRGLATTDAPAERSTVVNLTLPTNIFNQHVVQNIQVNINNQVTKAGDQELVTIQSGQMDKMLIASKVNKLLNEKTAENKLKELSYVSNQSNFSEKARTG